MSAASVDLPFAYQVWIKRFETKASLTADPGTAVGNWKWRPRFSVLLHADGGFGTDQLERSMQSIRRQSYPFWTVVGEPLDALEPRLWTVPDDHVVLLRVGDVLGDLALFRFAEALQRDRNATILYGDEDRLDGKGRRSAPWFKPRWNAEMFLAQDFMSGATAIETDLARQAAAGAQGDLAALLLAATVQAHGKIIHLPHVLCHVTGPVGGGPKTNRLGAVANHVRPRGATCEPGPFGTVKVRWPLPVELPLVTIIVPTRDRLELLKPCIEGVLDRTDYANFEVLIIDNGSVEQATAEFLANVTANPQVSVRAFEGRYNFSAMNNFAVGHARGSYVCLLNNDTDVVEPCWLTEMMRYAVRTDVGAVGAKLLYPDGTIQHAGVVIGLGGAAGHAHRFLSADQPGYFRFSHVAQFVSAVTAACLVVERKKFEAVGGLDEELAVAFNDVDFCLKIQAAGWRNVYVPHAVLLHHESKTRGSDIAPEQIDRFHRELRLLQERWETRGYQDPLHNPNLDPASETFVIRI